MGIPGTQKVPWYDCEWPLELLGGVPPVVAAVWAATQIFLDPAKPQGFGWVFVAMAMWLVIAGGLRVLRGLYRDRKRQERESPQDLAGCAHVVHRLLREHCQFPPGDDRCLRVTIHRVVKPDDGKEWYLEQVIPYVGARGGPPGRPFSIRSGIIGLVAREHEPFTFTWPADVPAEKFIGDLVKKWNYTRPEAEDLISDRRAWMGVPIKGEGDEAIGVVFLDSNRENLFTKDVQNLIVGASLGIADFVRERYD